MLDLSRGQTGYKSNTFFAIRSHEVGEKCGFWQKYLVNWQVFINFAAEFNQCDGELSKY